MKRKRRSRPKGYRVSTSRQNTLGGIPLVSIGEVAQIIYRDKRGRMRYHTFKVPPSLSRLKDTFIVVIAPVDGTNELEG